MNTILLIPDMHVSRGDKLHRLDKLKNFIYAQPVPPDAIVQIGDLFDFESLCLHDKDTAAWSRRSLAQDIEAGKQALEKLDSLARLLSVPLYYLGGNHEHRYDTWMASDNRLATSPFPKSIAELLKSYGRITYYPFGKVLLLNGAAFVHYFVSGVMNRAHSGERPALSMLRTHHMSCIAGHKHTLDFAEHTRPDGSKIYALVGGCFVDPKKKFSYAGQARKLWWEGVHLLTFTKPGEFDLQSVSTKQLMNY